ncbi:hypothetical protein BTO20_16665 [Mycobacterium dioxanotrophicus]|uniref:Ester cyclase n=1 Tax=Mycobacterium dioxanotrophicus TaxID=482462 RepID=A0A1Y0C465_9MYCO|nr:ester cyclase [Mycobacterium dioxanotrophicus]ART69991.1 hypothetical protein BTO20_16665 [Mycobacterium dioxanotrophicus]
MSDVDERRVRIQQVWEAAWDRGEVDDLDKLLSPAYLRFGTSSSGQSLADFKASIVSTRAAFPDLLTVIDEVVIEGDRAAIRWHSTGTHQHPFMGVPATRRTVSISGSTFARFADDRVVEEFVTWDPRALLTALGIITVGQDQ